MITLQINTEGVAGAIDDALTNRGVLSFLKDVHVYGIHKQREDSIRGLIRSGISTEGGAGTIDCALINRGVLFSGESLC